MICSNQTPECKKILHSIPNSVTYLTFKENFNQEINNNNLIYLKVSETYNLSLANVNCYINKEENEDINNFIEYGFDKNILLEELVKKYMHPSKIVKYMELYGEDYDDYI